MGKKRVYAVAKELNKDSKEVLDALKELGVKVKSNLSSIDDDAIEKLKKYFSKEKIEEKVEEPIPPVEEELEEEEVLEIYVEPEPKVAPPKKKKKKKKKERKVDAALVEKRIKETRSILETGKRKKYKKKKKTGDVEVEEEVLKVPPFMTVSELAEILDVGPNDILMKCLELGLRATINQRLDFDTISLIAEEFGQKVEMHEEFEAEIEEGEYSDIREKPPVVTIMGHVDHGKTTLIDKIRLSDLVSKEKGRITQKIGAYHVNYSGKTITFIDTPGHEAFTAMRARGAKVTDIVVLVVAANDGVKPQTIEAIDHAKAAGVPIIVAINKIDLPDANPEKVKMQLADVGVIVQEYGGDVMSVNISALKGIGIDELLDTIILLAEDMDLKAPFEGPGEGYILEAKKSKGFGNVATVIVEKGRIKKGDPFIAGSTYGKVRVMIDEDKKIWSEVTPGIAVQISSFNDLPVVGDKLKVVKDEKTAKEIAEKRKAAQRIQEMSRKKQVSLEAIQEKLVKGEYVELKIVLKGDDSGAVEALSDTLVRLSTDEVHVNIIHRGVGDITENDVLLASASDAIIVGFRTRPTGKARDIAKNEGVEIRTYDIIYDVVDDIKKAMSGLLAPEYEEHEIGRAEVRMVIRVPKVGNIAGSYVIQGKVLRGAKCNVLRGEEVIAESKINSLKRFKEDVKEVVEGFECGIGLEDFDSFQEGDIIVVYETIEKERTI